MAKVTLKYQDGTTKVRHSRDEFRNEDEKLNAPVAIDYETVDELSLRDMNLLLSPITPCLHYFPRCIKSLGHLFHSSLPTA